MEELTSFKNEKYSVGNHASNLDFIVTKLKTLIDKKYRTKTTKKNTSMMGSSLGELVFFMPIFNAYMCLEKEGIFSPSFWLSDQIYDATKKYKDIYIYIYIYSLW